MIGLWVGFALTIDTTLSTWTARIAAAALLGLVSGPLAYGAGVRVHALTLVDGTLPAVVVVGGAWAVALPVLAQLSRVCARLPTKLATVRRRAITIPRTMLLFALLVAVLVAVLGIINTLTVSITDRRRELGVLQAVGALRNQVRRTIWLEAMAIGVVGLLIGLLFGVVALYYTNELTMKEIGGMLGINESRVSQIHKAALEKMNTALEAAGINSAHAF